MLLLQVDLSPYSDEDYEKRYKLLDGFSFTLTGFLDRPKIYQVTWDSKESVESVLNIPSSLVRHLGGST